MSVFVCVWALRIELPGHTTKPAQSSVNGELRDRITKPAGKYILVCTCAVYRCTRFCVNCTYPYPCIPSRRGSIHSQVPAVPGEGRDRERDAYD